MTDRRPSERGPVTRVALECLLEQTKRLRYPGNGSKVQSIGAQVEIVGSQVVSRAGGNPHCLRGLQCWLENASYACRHLVLKIENVFKRAVEAIDPQMNATRCVDQLRGDPNSLPRLAHRAFEHVADA